MTQETSTALDPRLLGAVDWRCIGPPRGGRVLAVAGDPVDQATFYFGAVAGGIWKTDDAGLYWQNISDGYLNTSSVGRDSGLRLRPQRDLRRHGRGLPAAGHHPR